MTYIESHSELGGHPKTKRLARLLGISRVQVVGHLQFLWWWAADYAPSGDLTNFEPDVIADGALWEGDPEVFQDALVNCMAQAGGAGFLERTPDARLCLHDWAEYGGKLHKKRETDAQRKREERDAQRTQEAAPAPPPRPAPQPARTAAPSTGQPAPKGPVSVGRPNDASSLSNGRPSDGAGRGEESRGEEIREDKKQSREEQTNNPPTSLAAPPDHPEADLDAGCVGVLEDMLRFVKDRSEAAGLLRRYGCEMVRWQVAAMDWRFANGRGDSITDPGSYLLTALQRQLPLPAAINERREQEERLRKAERVQADAQQRATAEQVKRAGQERLEAAWANLAPEEQQDIEREARERLCAEQVVFRTRSKKKPETWTEPPDARNALREMRNALLVERGHVPDGQAEGARA